MTTFSERLRELRTEKSLSARALAALVDLNKASINNWENGTHDIKSEYLIRLAKFFNVSTDYLLGLTDD